MIRAQLKPTLAVCAGGAALIGALGLGCSAETPLASTAVADVPPAESSATAPPVSSDVSWRELEAPPPVGCLVPSVPATTVHLALTPHGAEALAVHRPEDGQLRLLAGADGGPLRTYAWLRVGGLSLRGWVGETRLHLARPVWIAGLALPYARTALTVVDIRDDRPVVRFSPAGVRLRDGPLQAELDCDALTAKRVPSEDAWREARGSEHATNANLVRLPIAFSRVPDGAPRGELLGTAPIAVGLMARQNGRARVLVHTANASLMGWVDGKAVVPSPGPASPPGWSTRHSWRGRRPGSVEERRCPHRVRVVLEMRGTRRIVGGIEPNTPFRVGVASSALRPLYWRYVSTGEESRLLVPAQDMRGCGAPEGP